MQSFFFSHPVIKAAATLFTKTVANENISAYTIVIARLCISTRSTADIVGRLRNTYKKRYRHQQKIRYH